MEVVTLGESMVFFNPGTEGSIKHVHQFTKSIAGEGVDFSQVGMSADHPTGITLAISDTARQTVREAIRMAK